MRHPANSPWPFDVVAPRSGIGPLRAALNRIVSNVLLPIVIAAAAIVAASPASAATLTWGTSGTGGAGTWNAASSWWDGTSQVNWSSAVPDSAVFQGTGGTVALSGPITAGGITFNTFTGSYAIGTASQTLTINGGGITMNAGSGVVTLASPVSLGTSQSWTNNSSSLLTATNAIANGGFRLTVDGPGNTTLSGTVSGTGGITKSGTGTLTLSGANSYSGGTALNGSGAVIISNASSFGTGSVSVTGSSRIEANIGITYGNAIDVGAALTTQVSGTTSGTAAFSGVLSGSNPLTVFGGSGTNSPRTIFFSNTNNTFTGNVMTGTAAGINDVFQFASIGDGGNFTFARGNSGGTQVVYSGSSAITFNTRQIVLASTLTGTTGKSGIGTSTNGFDNSSTNPLHTVTFNTPMGMPASLAGNAAFVFGGVNSGDNTFAGVIGAPGGSNTLMIIKRGSGKWILSSTSNAYTGDTWIWEGGTLSVPSLDAKTNNQPLGKGSLIRLGSAATTGTLEVTGSGTSSTDKQVQIGDTSSGGGRINNHGAGALTFTSSTFNVMSGTVARTLTLGGTGAGISTIQGVIQNNNSFAVSLTKADAGTWVLSGANTYTGTTTVSAGVLRLDSANALSGGIGSTNGISALTINGGVIGLGNGDFARGLGTGTNQVQITGGGGFAAYNADRTVNLGGNGTPTSLTWGSGSFITTAGGTFVLGAAAATNMVTFQNPIDLGASGRTVRVDNGSADVDATLSGVLSSVSAGNGLTKTGVGTLDLTAANSFNGTLAVQNGIVRFTSLAAGSGSQNLGAGTLVNLGVAATSAGEIDYRGTGGTLDKNITALGSGRNRILNSGTGTLALSGTLTKNGTILELAGGTFAVSGLITGASANSDLFVNGANVTLSNTNNDYNGPTYVYGGGSLTLGASNVIPAASSLILGGTGSDTGTGTINTGLFTDTVLSLTTGNLGATIGITGSGVTMGGLTTTGNLTFGAGTDTLALTLTSPSLGRYTLLSYASRTGTFDSVTGNGDYNVVYGGTSIDLQMKANQAATFTLTPAAAGGRVLVGGSTQLSGGLANSSLTGAAALIWSPVSTGSLSTINSSLGSTIAAGSTSTITAWISAGNTAGTQNWSLINTDNNAITTTSTASGSITVVDQRSFSVSNSGTINLGNFLRTASVTGSATISSSGLNANTANATLGSFSGTSTNGFSLATLDSPIFNGSTSSQSALYTLSGSAASAGAINGTFSSAVSAELGSIAPVTVSLVGTAYNPAIASFTAVSATTSWLVNIGEFNQNTGDHTAGFDIYNLFSGDPTYAADLMLLSITPIGTAFGSVSTNLATFDNLAPGLSNNWTATLSSLTTGTFSNEYQLNFVSAKDGQSLGGSQSMTLTVTGIIIVPEPGALALAGIGITAAAYALRRRHEATPRSPGRKPRGYGV